MCGRFCLDSTGQTLQRIFRADGGDEIVPRYNIAPGQQAPVVLQDRKGPRSIRMHKWGLVPRWAKDAKIGHRMINARAETVAEKPSFRQPLKSGRCLVPTTGFYEWQAIDGAKQPWLFHLDRSETVFAFAGLHERWSSPDGEVLDTFTIITTEANEQVRPFHHRMPVILPEMTWHAWLSPAPVNRVEPLVQLLQPWSGRTPISANRVSTRVNDPRFDQPECLVPLQEES